MTCEHRSLAWTRPGVERDAQSGALLSPPGLPARARAAQGRARADHPFAQGVSAETGLLRARRLRCDRAASGSCGRPGCRIAYTLGWRRGEVFGLERRHVHLETGALTLEQTKNGDARRAYLPADLVAELREHLAKVDALRVAWAQACKAAGRPGTIFHDLRRSGVRNMVRAGVSETVAMKISGRCNSSLFRRYNITSDEDLRAERMGMSSGITEPGVSKTRLVSMRSS
jgi:integrase